MGEPAAVAAPPASSASSRQLRVEELGLLSYPAAVALQDERAAARVAGRIPDTLLLLEHPPVFTVGRDGRTPNLQVPFEALADLGIALHQASRGGDITYHGPGQLVGYPILDLREHRRDVRWYVGKLEEALVGALGRFGLPGDLDPAMHGVFVRGRKIAAIGIHVGRWVTTHGFALNVSVDLRPFDYIHPCGVAGARVTSMGAELGRAPAMVDVRREVASRFCEVFGLERA